MVLPVSTPPNAIVYATGRVPITQMVRYGLLMGALTLVLVPAVTLAVMSVVNPSAGDHRGACGPVRRLSLVEV